MKHKAIIYNIPYSFILPQPQNEVPFDFVMGILRFAKDTKT